MAIDLIRYGFYFSLHNCRRLHRKAASLLDSSKSKNESFEIKKYKEAAKELGINVEYLGHGAYEFKSGKITRRIKEDDLRTDVDSAFTFWLCGDKYVTFKLLEKNGIRCLPHYQLYSFSTMKDASRDFLNRKTSVVVKPCFGTSGGKGVTVDVRNITNFRRAIFAALMYDRNYLVEDFIEGDHFRILFCKGNMLGATKRIPANVKADGINSLKKLIHLENDKRSKDANETVLYPIILDNDLRQTLKKNNMTMDYVPDKGEIVYVKSVVNIHAGGETEEISKIISEDILSECRKVVKIMNVSLAGIDIITYDITRPLGENGGVINEVNTSPGLSCHYKVRNQDERKDVAKEILKLLFEID